MVGAVPRRSEFAFGVVQLEQPAALMCVMQGPIDSEVASGLDRSHRRIVHFWKTPLFRQLHTCGFMAADSGSTEIV